MVTLYNTCSLYISHDCSVYHMIVFFCFLIHPPAIQLKRTSCGIIFGVNGQNWSSGLWIPIPEILNLNILKAHIQSKLQSYPNSMNSKKRCYKINLHYSHIPECKVSQICIICIMHSSKKIITSHCLAIMLFKIKIHLPYIHFQKETSNIIRIALTNIFRKLPCWTHALQ